MINKIDFLLHLKEIVSLRISEIDKDIKAAITDRNNDSKSTAGDKHETSRALAEIEINKLKLQMSMSQKSLELLNKIDASKKSQQVAFGAIVECQNANYFISIGLGKIEYQNQSIYCISLASDLGKTMATKQKGESFTFNTNTITIQDLY